MFDLGASELLLVVIVAVIVIGPKDMPLALRTAGRWIGKVRKLSSHFRAGLDAMVREAEMEDMEAKWKAQNERVMRQHPNILPTEMEPTGALPTPTRLPDGSEAKTESAGQTPAAGSDTVETPTSDQQLPLPTRLPTVDKAAAPSEPGKSAVAGGASEFSEVSTGRPANAVPDLGRPGPPPPVSRN